jgi:hypothetical protein
MKLHTVLMIVVESSTYMKTDFLYGLIKLLKHLMNVRNASSNNITITHGLKSMKRSFFSSISLYTVRIFFVQVNGKQTQHENTADIVGLKLAYFVSFIIY